MAKRHNEYTAIGDVLKEFIDHNNLKKGIEKINVDEAWKNTMGPAIVKYTTTLKFEHPTLYVQLSSSVLREELSYGKTKIIKLLNEELGEELIKNLVLR
ncbi:MAG TPA: DUF721 domain-containing protein [Flavobacteriaceae bacterium]|nr:DUF721 domain-containing protein [Flavobacteriaceae bacterium]